MAEALPILAARLPAPVLAGDVHWRPALGFWGPVALPIRFRLAALDRVTLQRCLRSVLKRAPTELVIAHP